MSRLPAIARWAAALTIACAATHGAGAQERGAAALGPLVAGLGTSVRVLVVGAHPDDDAPALIAFLARGRHARVAYLSLTRGEGGVNVIGGEGSEALGVLRTEELLAARRVDGGETFFTRAFDFGVSKSVDETRERWWGDGQLGDVVRIVRAFRPHVIVSVHDTTDRDPHAHHRVAGLLAREAFEAAASDTTRYKRGGWGQPWRTLKLYQLVADRAGGDSAGADGVGVDSAAVDGTATLRVPVGEFAPLLGRSYAEVGAESRGKQRSQGLGVVGRAGARAVGLRLVASRVSGAAGADASTFAGIDTTFARLRRDGQDPGVAAAIDSIAPLVARAQGAYRAEDPSAAAEPIAALVTLAARAAARAGLAPPGARFPAPADADVARSLEDLWRRAQDALVLASGVAVEATAERELVAQATATDSSDTLRVNVAVFNRGRSAVGVDLALLSNAPNARAVPRATVLPDSAWRGAIAGTPRTVTQPWWREGGRIDDMYSADVDGRPEEERATSPESGAVRVTTRLRIAGAEAYVTVPVVRRAADPVRGEQARPVAVAPGITARFERAAEYARAGTPLVRPLRVTVRSAYGAPRDVVVSLVLQNAPQGLRVDSSTRRLALPAQGTRVVTFLLRGTLDAGDYNLRAVAMVHGDTAAGSAAKVARYDLSGGVVEYDHIAPQRMYYQVAMRLRAARVTVPANLAVGYVSGGTGDPTPSALTQLGIPVTPIDPAALLLPGLDLSRFGAIVVGPRAYATRPELLDVTPVLHAFVRAGGTLVVQQGQYEMAQSGVLPFPVTYALPAQRVTREDAPVGLLEPRAAVLRAPNAIVDADFQGWVHERAAFMPSAFDPRWRAALAMSDPDEPLNRAGILVAPMGRGAYVYTTLSFPRQFAAAHGGAARLFVNLLAGGVERGARSEERRADAGGRPR